MLFLVTFGAALGSSRLRIGRLTRASALVALALVPAQFMLEPARMAGSYSGVLDVWLSYMDALSQRQDDPEQALREYIAGKLRFSREHPDDSRVYANEVVSGAPIFSDEIAERVIPALQADVAIFNRWAEQGLCRPVDGRHLMILLWASTQVYADWASQISLVLGKKKLGAEDFSAAESLIVDMVLRTVLVTSPATLTK